MEYFLLFPFFLFYLSYGFSSTNIVTLFKKNMLVIKDSYSNISQYLIASEICNSLCDTLSFSYMDRYPNESLLSSYYPNRSVIQTGRSVKKFLISFMT